MVLQVHRQSPTQVHGMHGDNFTFANDGKQLMKPVTYCPLKTEMKSKQHFHAKTLLYFVKIRLFYFEKTKKNQ
jgi:hypothetical protein